MRPIPLIVIAPMLATASAFGQSSGPDPTRPAAAAPAGPANPAARATVLKPATASTPESRSAAELALSHEPTFDEGTA